MSSFTLYPAIDLREGRVVRLTQGDWDQSTFYQLMPAQAAEGWISQGAEWLHVINLDGAFGKDTRPNLDALAAILRVSAGRASVQFGGGMRSFEAINKALEMGVARVILGTAAVRDPDLMVRALNEFGPEKIVLGIDAKDGVLQVAGWEQATQVTPKAVASRFVEYGLATIIFTNIRRDGMGQGVDVPSTKSLAEALPCEVIASGGVGSLADIKLVKQTRLPGVVVGKALYENAFSLTEAIEC